MDQHVWISNVLADTELIIMFNSDIAEKEVDKAVEGLKLLKPGKPVPRELCPRQVWNDKGRKNWSHLPHLSVINGFPIVSETATDIFRQFDLGEGALYPIEGIYQSDRTTRIAGDYFCWVFGNQKTAFLPQESPDKQPFGVKVDGEYVRWNMPVLLRDDQLAVSGAALDGPDVWVDPLLFRSVFLSSALGDALNAAGLGKAFRLFRSRVI
jgi:hypothetical protein